MSDELLETIACVVGLAIYLGSDLVRSLAEAIGRPRLRAVLLAAWLAAVAIGAAVVAGSAIVRGIAISYSP